MVRQVPLCRALLEYYTALKSDMIEKAGLAINHWTRASEMLVSNFVGTSAVLTEVILGSLQTICLDNVSVKICELLP